MLRWIVSLAMLCIGSAALAFSHITPIHGNLSGLCLAVSALSATLLIGSFEAYETQAVPADRDDG